MSFVARAVCLLWVFGWSFFLATLVGETSSGKQVVFSWWLPFNGFLFLACSAAFGAVAMAEHLHARNTQADELSND